MPAVRYQKRERAARQAAFLKALSMGRPVRTAAKEAGLSAVSLYRQRRTEPDFAKRWQAALDTRADETFDPLEVEARRRAVEGVDKPVYRGGQLVGHVRDYSDSMLMFLLKAKYPERYGGRDAKSEDADSSLDVAGARDALLSKFTKATK